MFAKLSRLYFTIFEREKQYGIERLTNYSKNSANYSMFSHRGNFLIDLFLQTKHPLQRCLGAMTAPCARHKFWGGGYCERRLAIILNHYIIATALVTTIVYFAIAFSIASMIVEGANAQRIAKGHATKSQDERRREMIIMRVFIAVVILGCVTGLVVMAV